MSNIAHQKYCYKSALSGVVGGCPRVAWPISSWHAAFVVCKFVSRNASNLNQNNAKMYDLKKNHPLGTVQKQSRQKIDFKTLRGGARKGAYNGPWAPLG